MAGSLMDVAKEYLTPDLISKLSGLVGESPSLTNKAIEMIVPSLTGAAYHQASTPSGASNLVQALSALKPNANFLSNLTGLVNSGKMGDVTALGGGLLTSLLGSNTGSIANVIARSAGVSGASSSTLLQFGAPLLAGLLGRMIPGGSFSPAALTNLLSTQKDTIFRHIPPEVAGILGLSATSKVSEAPEPVVRPVITEEKRSRPWIWLIPLLGIVLAFIGWRSCSHPTGSRLETLNLPCGTSIQVLQGSFDEGVASFMMKGSSSDLPKRFTFDHLVFDTNSAQTTPDSKDTLSNLIATAKCFPAMQMSLVGFTDNTGTPDGNKKLSLDRANSVKDAMVGAGVDANRISTEGAGQDNPVASNDTDEGRAKNRRTELVVTKMK